MADTSTSSPFTAAYQPATIGSTTIPAPGANATAAEWDAWNQANFGANSAFANQFSTIDPSTIAGSTKLDLSNLDLTQGQAGKDITEMTGWSMANPGATSAQTENRYQQLQDKNALVTQLGGENPASTAISWALAEQGVKSFQDIGVRQENGQNVIYNKTNNQPLNTNRMAMIGNGQHGIEGGDLFFNMAVDNAGNLTFNPEFIRRRTAADNVFGQIALQALKFTPAAPFAYAIEGFNAAGRDDPLGVALAALGGAGAINTSGLTPDKIGSDWATSGAGTTAATIPADIAAANTAATINNLTTGLQVGKMVVDQNWAPLLTMGGNALGAGNTPIGNTGFTLGDVGRFAAIGTNLANEQYGNALIGLAPYLNSPNTELAGKALNLQRAIEIYENTGNPAGLIAARITWPMCTKVFCAGHWATN
jgi:hypothetical protein